MIYGSCEGPGKEKEDILIGNWEAEWNTPAESYPMADQNKLSMKGQIKFDPNGMVEIQAYGYEGCIFMSDTMKNELNWRINGDTLSLVGPGEDFGLPYTIREARQNIVKLVLMEDIALTLKKI
ncbi:MAG: hypothetical protein ACNS62_20795 [Candidatus Cyclobacteriaceae bacterium M3_2C_046]